MSGLIMWQNSGQRGFKKTSVQIRRLFSGQRRMKFESADQFGETAEVYLNYYYEDRMELKFDGKSSAQYQGYLHVLVEGRIKNNV